MSDFSSAWHMDNLKRAWGWIRSNPDRAYKTYFRDLYSVYASADSKLLENLKQRLTEGAFNPSNAGKIFFPKPSGILRPYTLLNIEDQIVYQAMTNVIAEKLAPHVRSRYYKQVFGHLYAGSNSTWFYKKWSDGYRAFNKSSQEAFTSGYVWTASFDLTAFYDSIDHNVLRHMLSNIGLENEFSKLLTEYLAKWTATSTQIYHNHGIPQGPISSGLIAEVVLKHFDDQKISKYDVKYFRYVDDIRLFAKKEDHLRQALVALDLLSKDMGLFPQSGKIDIHLIKNISDELKSISTPIDSPFSKEIVDQSLLHKEINRLSPKFSVIDSTKFKFLIAKANPSSMLIDRLWKIYEKSPHFYPLLTSQLAKYKEIPYRHAVRLISEIEMQDLYPAVRAEFIKSSISRLPPSLLKSAKLKFKKMWHPKINQIDLSDALWNALCRLNGFTDAQMKYGFSGSFPSWLQMKIHFGVDWNNLPLSQKQAYLTHSLQSKSVDVAIASGWICGLYEIPLPINSKKINPLAKILLKEMGLLRRASGQICGIRSAIEDITGCDFDINWRKFFGARYKQAQLQIIQCRGYAKTDASAWINSMDVFNDLFLDALYARDKKIGGYILGKIGSNLGSTKLKKSYPITQKYVEAIHTKRSESPLSHPIVKNTKKSTKPIQFKWIKSGSKLLKKSIEEIKSKGY